MKQKLTARDVLAAAREERETILTYRRTIHRDPEVGSPTPRTAAYIAGELKKLGYKTAALALNDNSVSIDDPELMKEEKLAVILGNEGEGLEDETIARCDYTVKIPMAHGVDSLNVAAASAVAFWQLGKIKV